MSKSISTKTGDVERIAVLLKNGAVMTSANELTSLKLVSTEMYEKVKQTIKEKLGNTIVPKGSIVAFKLYTNSQGKTTDGWTDEFTQT